MRREQLAALARLAGAQKDADLARLAGVSVRLNAAVRARDDLEAALAQEIAVATAQPDMQLLRILDAHVILAEKSRTGLEAEITRITHEKDALRQICAKSFGRAEVLAQLGKSASHKKSADF
ncbi:MAG: hypothetical protein WBC90_05220 [Albidovulum sp.]